MTEKRTCIRGCTVAGAHYAACPSFGLEAGECRGCVGVVAAPGALVCTGCVRRIRRHLADAPNLVAHLRSIADPQKSTWNADKLRTSSSRPELPAPVAADLIDATADILRTLREWAAAVDAEFVDQRMPLAGIASDVAFFEADRCAEVILDALDHLANRVEIVRLADALLTVHRGEPDWWSVADAAARWSLDDRPRWADKPCPECDTRTVRVLPPRGRRARSYHCTTCNWEASGNDDAGLWRDVFDGDGVVSTAPHDPRWLTLTQVAARSSRTVGTVRAWIVRGELHGFMGRYYADHVDELVKVKRGDAA